MHEAVEWGRTEEVALLLDSGANVEATDWLGFTPLHLAVLGVKATGAFVLGAAGFAVLVITS